MAGLEAQLGLVVTPRAIGDASDCLAVGGHCQAKRQMDVVDEVTL